MIYSLYHNKNDAKLIIKPYQGPIEKITNEEMILYWNENMWIANNRQILREKARDIKENWIYEAKSQLREFENLIIKVKY